MQLLVPPKITIKSLKKQGGEESIRASVNGEEDEQSVGNSTKLVGGSERANDARCVAWSSHMSGGRPMARKVYQRVRAAAG